MHLLWMAELLRQLKGRLPAGFRAYLGAGPALAVGGPAARPDLSVRRHELQHESRHEAPNGGGRVGPLVGLVGASADPGAEPDVEIAVATLDPTPALLVERDGRLVSAVELISPRNKVRAVARTTYARRYAGYLLQGVHLLVVDVHARPEGFSFADEIAAELQLDHQAPWPPPAATGGRWLAIWRRALRVGDPLPVLPLPLTSEWAVTVELEPAYSHAAEDSYLA